MDVEIFLSATNVWTGNVEIFSREELTADHVMASACVPSVFQAVEIDGVPYWDGGHMGDPALFPLFYETMTKDILLVQIDPMERRQTPRTARDIHNRLNAVTCKSNLLRELRAVAFVKQLIEEGKLAHDEYTNVHLHRIDGTGVLDEYEACRGSTHSGISSCSYAMSGGGPLSPGLLPITKRSVCATPSICRRIWLDASQCRSSRTSTAYVRIVRMPFRDYVARRPDRLLCLRVAATPTPPSPNAFGDDPTNFQHYSQRSVNAAHFIESAVAHALPER
jgi:hypothetical protein